MAEDSTLQIVVRLKNEASASLKELQSNLDNVRKSMQPAINASQQFAVGITAATASVGTFAYQALQSAANIETQRIGFQTLLGSVEKADEAIKMIQRDAASTPFEFSGLVEANKALTLVTKNAQQSEDVLLNVGKALAAAGKGQNELNSIIVNLQQIGNTGKISEMDIRQFGFAGVNILELLADYYGTTKEAASDMVKNSKDAFADLSAAFKMAGSDGGRFADAFTNASGSFNQVLSNLKDQWNIFLSNQGAKLLEWGKQFILLVTDMVQNTLPKWIAQIEQVIDWVTKNQWAIVAVAGAITGALVPAVLGAAAAFGAWLVALGPFILAGAGLALLVEGIRNFNPLLIILASAITAAVIPALVAMIPPITGVAMAFAGLAIAAAPWIIGGAIIGGIIAGIVWIIKNWELVKSKATEIWNGILGFMKTVWSRITEGFQSAWDGVATYTANVWENIKNTVKSSVNFIIDKINSFIRAANAVTGIGSGIGISVPKIPEIPMLADGGIVTGPTLAMIGEAGPEAVVPLSRYGSMGGPSGSVVNITINNPQVRSDDDITAIRREIDAYFRPLLINHKLTA